MASIGAISSAAAGQQTDSGEQNDSSEPTETGEQNETGEPAEVEGEVRIVARRLAGGRTEFGLQQRQTDDSWGERLLPRVRFFPTDARIERWLSSSPFTATVRTATADTATAEVTLRIVARKLDDGRIEFGLQQRQTDDSWGERLLPRVRFFPTDARIERWLSSSPLTVTAAPATEDADDATGTTAATTEFTAVVAGFFHSCGLRSNGTVACWGENGWGQADAPEGSFSALTASASHSCGLRSDATLTCWGNNQNGQTNAPDGQFSIISAGPAHSCGLRSDATLTCWGNNFIGQTDAPQGIFTAVSAGGSHTCGLRSDATLTCWGNNENGQSDAPTGRFSAITAGGSHTCGLRDDTFIACWGENWAGQASNPSGRFSAVATGWSHSCGVRDDGTIFCWGNNSHGQLHVPQGGFSAVAAGWYHSCGLRPDATIACWGGESRETVAADGQFSAISTGGSHSCGLRPDATIACWGSNVYGQTSAPDGRYSAVAAGDWHSCGLRDDGTVACWGDNYRGQTAVADGQFSALSAGQTHSCGLRPDATIACWGQSASGQADPPEGQFRAVSAGASHSCGVRDDATIACWGSNDRGETAAPAGSFSAVSAGNGFSCGVRTDDTITCWGVRAGGATDAPEEQFRTVAAGVQHSCGVRADSTIACWGYGGGLADPPGGSFSAVAVGERHSCGLRSDGTAVCWGLGPTAAAPTGVVIVAPDPSECRPYGVRSEVTAGFPLAPGAVAATGTMRVAVVFVDFPDAAAANPTRREAESSLPEAELYLETVSYGKLDIEFVALHGWLRAEQDHDHYLAESVIAGQQALDEISEEAVRLADPDFDFTGFDSVMIVMPSSRFSGGNAERRLATEEGVVPALVRINVFPLDEAHDGPLPWGGTALHELIHNLGLVDYYPYDSSHELPEAPRGKTWVSGSFGPMGMGIWFLADARDRRLAYIVHHPNGARSAEYGSILAAREMLAWSRWQLGWLDASQIRCITDSEATVSLTPLAAPGDGPAMAAIPLSDTELIVVESRRRIGYDEEQQYRWPNGARTRFPALATEGVLVYTVDTARGTGQLPIRVAGDTGNGQIDAYPILTVGQSVTIGGYTITVQSATDTTHTVTIAKSAAAT